jgi:hypothetical protein
MTRSMVILKSSPDLAVIRDIIAPRVRGVEQLSWVRWEGLEPRPSDP